MLRIVPPKFGTQEAFRLCLSASISKQKKTLLSNYESKILTAAAAFEQACRAATLHNLDPANFAPQQGHESDADDLVGMYTRRMGPEYPGRPVYDEARNRRIKCPLCGVGSVRQVDHHLPKSTFPYLAVVPMNLVPVCADCNFLKGEKFPKVYSEQTLHPYFDEIDDQRWLHARLITLSSTGQIVASLADAVPSNWYVKFFVSPPSAWRAELTERVQYHFEAFNLAQLYEDQAADDLTGIELSMEEAYQAGGAPDVRELLESMARSRKRPHNNTWMVALYEGLASNSWYCSGGFRQVAAG
ncbi:HNH endonuclease signature motif containing protein [Streptomyces sp. NBC_00103]|uniref:HNH endonuclease signature motif containing protein n=1 Tax=Streptomyces sp. NBC_00103 TaxID=2975653 RepID=UPI002255DA40|nr:HNH endonuclease signature motif containing protein [Streptomyces sp. NBC_00103]MCX5367963.1 HNH endonuclease [Streptomyces sp. NBC_00103]